MDDSTLNNYQRLLNAFSTEEMQQIVQVKRFFEWYEGDSVFRKSVNTGQISADQQRRLKEIGVFFPIQEISLLWEKPEVINEYFCCNGEGEQTHSSSDAVAAMDRYPLLKLWYRFSRHRYNEFKKVCAHRLSVPASPKFDAWRNRRIASAESELGAFNHKIDHPVMTLELCDGCSVQCWFCSFSADKLKGVLDYNENRSYFRKIVRTCVDLFGPEAAGLALLYYATEPHDNPHYIDYMKEFARITGSTVCTATAVCTDYEWVKSLIAYYRQYTQPWPRLSVLSTRVLHKIHEQFSPDELRDVAMIMQMRDSAREKVSGGRIFDVATDMRERDSTNYLQDVIPQGSIACVTGFYINLIRKDIKLISPCYTSEKWPYGYRVFDEAQFESAGDFRDVMVDMIDRSMPVTPPAGMPFRFRDDLVLKPLENGFDLVSPNQIHHFHDKSVFRAMGDLLTQPVVSFQEAGDILMNRYGQNLFEVHAAMGNMFQGGFLDEVGISGVQTGIVA